MGGIAIKLPFFALKIDEGVDDIGKTVFIKTKSKNVS
jgi:hypothetical protein